jgi:6-pyruvoyltetrahydropterin/6-carboxytetrahydropterin synthase
MSKTCLQLAKQNFKFSSAHFLIFDATNAERLHGHNYRVEVEIGAPSAANNPGHKDAAERGFFIDFNVFKSYIKAALDRWDERVLLPGKQPEMKFAENGDSLEVRFRDRFYVFPKSEVIQLPVNNTSVENLSQLLAADFMREFSQYHLSHITVYVEETPGQGAATTIEAPALNP